MTRATRVETASLIRLLAFAKPYTGLIVLALALSAGYSGSRFLRAYLIKPLLDDVVLPGAILSEDLGGSWLPELFPASSRAQPEATPHPRSAPTSDSKPPADSTARPQEIREDFLGIAALAALLIVSMPVLMFSRSYLVEFVLGRIHIDIKQRVCAHLLALPLHYHEDQRRGELLSRTMQDVDSAHGALRVFFGSLLQSTLNAAVGVAFLFAISWQLAASSLVLGPLVFGVISSFGRRIRHSARRRQEKLALVTGRLVEILSGIKTIKAFSAEAGEEAAFRRETDQLFKRSMRVVRNRVAARSLVEMLNASLGIGVVIAGTALVAWGWWGISAGDLAAFAAILGTTYKPVKDLARGWVRLMDAQPSAERFFEMLDARAEGRDAPDAVEISGVEHSLRLCDVSFSYGQGPVLRNVNLDVRAGEVIAIVGPTGAGKTTLADLLLRFYEPTSGHIEIDGIDLRDIRREALLEQIATVSQEPFLFDGSLRENLTYGRPGASEVEIRDAARAAHVEEFASQLPQGYDTPVGTGGVKLSGGQRQRLTIARALLKDPSILVFDEATSSLDAKSEQLVQDATLALFRGHRTVFVIAHRLSTIRRADRIAVLDGGRITQLGSHEELMTQPGLYREFALLQSSGDVR